MITAKIQADSINAETGDRLTSFLLVYPRFIHSELMTHRVFSRNAASSRAIPVERMMRTIRENPAMPVEWGKNQKGMQASEVLSQDEEAEAVQRWFTALDDALYNVERLLELGVHKQIANRLLEPWAHMTTLVTATEWGNFFRLRAHPAAQPEFQFLAYEMLKAYLESDPETKYRQQWHLPFRHEDDRFLDEETRIKVAVARCARTSYLTHDGEHSIEKDIKLYDRLLQSGHMSPFEHVATPKTGWCNNFYGWMQHRIQVEMVNQHTRPGRDELWDIYRRRPDWQVRPEFLPAPELSL